MPRPGRLLPRMFRVSTETRRLIAETRVLSGLLEGVPVTNDEVLRAALRKHKRTLRLDLSRKGYTREELSTIQRQAVEKYTPRSAQTTRNFDRDWFPPPVPVVDD